MADIGRRVCRDAGLARPSRPGCVPAEVVETLQYTTRPCTTKGLEMPSKITFHTRLYSHVRLSGRRLHTGALA